MTTTATRGTAEVGQGVRRALTVRDVAQALAVSQMTVRRLIERGALPSFRVGTQLRVPAHVLDALMAGEAPATRAEPGP